MTPKILKCLLFLGLTGVVVHAAGPKPPSHEEEVVRSTYAALSFLCSLEPISNAAIEQNEVSQAKIDRQVSDSTPVFTITHVQTGTIASIASQNWATRFSVPDKDTPVVLAGNTINQDWSDPDTPAAHWRFMRVHWDVDNSYTPERTAAMQAVTVGEAVEMNSTAAEGTWIGRAATYTRYANFDVTIKFQNRTIGPYTASFFFGKDAAGKEVVAPQDALVSGQLLWDALHPAAYPTDLIKTPGLHKNAVLDRWVRANVSNACSSARSDLCCSDGRCSLPEPAVAKDLAASTAKK